MAYALALGAYVVTVWRVARNKNLLENLQKLSPKDRIGALEIEMGGVRLAAGISPEQWVRSRIYKYYLLAFLATCFVGVTIFALALMNRTGGTSLAGFTYIGSMTVIENQYQQLNGGQLSDELKQRIGEAVRLSASEEFGRAIEILKGLPENARVPAILNNLGVAYAATKDDANARAAFMQAIEKGPDFMEARANLEHLDELKVAPTNAAVAHAADREIEPNNDIFHPNEIALNATIGSAIGEAKDVDYFTFKTPPVHRDLIEIVLENASTTLQPVITIFDAARSQIGATFNDTPAGDVRYEFASAPNSTYYVQISTSRYASVGAYRLTVKPRMAYDAFEPNDDIFQASPIQIGKPNQARITDPGDTDFYKFQTGAAGNVVVSLENRSTTLQPAITVFDTDRTQVGESHNDTPSGNVRYSFAAMANATYYVRVSVPRYASIGDYTLTVSPER
jgi:tetratricopeptide (TPR) repeat protein